MNCTAMKQESTDAISLFYSENSFRSAAALAVFVPPSQPLSKCHVIINADALAFANPMPGSQSRTTKCYATHNVSCFIQLAERIV